MIPDNVVDAFCRFAWTEPDDDALRALFSPDFRAATDPVVSVASVEGLVTFFTITRARVKTAAAERQITTRSKGWISACLTFQGTVIGTDKPFRFNGTTHLAITDGKIVEMWNCYNMLVYFIALGTFPPDFMEELMAQPIPEPQQVA